MKKELGYCGLFGTVGFVLAGILLYGCKDPAAPDYSVSKDVISSMTLLEPARDTTYDFRGADANASFTVRWRNIVFSKTSDSKTTWYLVDSYRICLDKDIYPRNGRRWSVENSYLDTFLVIKKSMLSTLPVSDSLYFLYVTASSQAVNVSDTRSDIVRSIIIRR